MLVNEIKETYNVEAEVDTQDSSLITVIGEDKELRKVQAFLDEKGFICDNEITGGVPDTYGQIFVCNYEEDGSNGYLVVPAEDAAVESLGLNILEAIMSFESAA